MVKLGWSLRFPDIVMNLLFLLCFNVETGYFKSLRLNLLVDPKATLNEGKIRIMVNSNIF